MAGILGFSLTAMASISLGVFTQPLEHAFGWSRADVASGFLAFAVTSLFLSPPCGHLIDRFGPRRVGLLGVALVGLTFALFATASHSLAYWLFLWVLFAIASQLAKPTIWTASVSSEFSASRGLATAVTLAGSGLGSSFAQIYSNYLIQAFGWRLAYVVMGLSWAGVVCLVNYFFLWGRFDRMRVARQNRTEAPTLPGMTLREGLRSSAFFKLAGAQFFGTLLLCAVMMQLVPVLTVTGLSRPDAVWIASTIGIASISGKLICGALVDRMPGKYIAETILALPIITCVALLTPTDDAVARLVPIIALGLSVGGQIHMIPYLGTRYFGLRAYGAIMGFIGSIVSIAVGLGPFLSGWVFDLTKSYDLVLTAGIPISIAGVLLILSLGRYPDEPAREERPRPIGAAEPAAAG
jgi:MFS family permease